MPYAVAFLAFNIAVIFVIQQFKSQIREWCHIQIGSSYLKNNQDGSL